MKIADRIALPMWVRRPRGFTLIELMIVLAIVAILTAVAYPSYTSHIRKAERKAAMAALQGLAQAMERYYAQANTYDGAQDENDAPKHFPKTSPIDGTAKYKLVITSATASAYTLQAQPISGKGQDKDGLLQLDSTGQRGWDRDLDGTISASEQTWKD